MKRILLSLITTGLLVLSLIPPQAAADSNSYIVGAWSNSNGEVTVSGSSGSYEGVVTKELTFEECVHKKGEVIWQILGPAHHSL
jgi:hypothetical protein